MLIHPWDAPLDDEEWRRFLVGRDFGHIAASTPDGGYPIVVPTHFVLDGLTVLVHLARPNPIWKVIGDGSKVTVVVTAVSDDTRHIGSGHSVSFSQKGAPSGAVEYVYFDSSTRGLKRWSER